MPCPKCGAKYVLRITDRKSKSQRYKCPECGHQWKLKSKPFLVSKK